MLAQEYLKVGRACSGWLCRGLIYQKIRDFLAPASAVLFCLVILRAALFRPKVGPKPGAAGMAEKADYLRAFDGAVRYFASDWDAAHPEVKRIPIGDKPHSIREVCALVAGFDDMLPGDVYDALCKEIHLDARDLRNKLGAAETYANAATCLILLMDRRVRVTKVPPKP